MPRWHSLFPDVNSSPLHASSILFLTLNYAFYWTIYSILYCKLYFTLYCTLHFSPYSSISITRQSDWLICLNPQGTHSFLPLGLFAEHYTVQYIVHYIEDCTVQFLLKFAVNPNIHCIVSPCCIKRKKVKFFQEIYSPWQGVPASSLMYRHLTVQCNLNCNVDCTLPYGINCTVHNPVYCIILHSTFYRCSSCW